MQCAFDPWIATTVSNLPPDLDDDEVRVGNDEVGAGGRGGFGALLAACDRKHVIRLITDAARGACAIEVVARIFGDTRRTEALRQLHRERRFAGAFRADDGDRQAVAVRSIDDRHAHHPANAIPMYTQ